MTKHITPSGITYSPSPEREQISKDIVVWRWPAYWVENVHFDAVTQIHRYGRCVVTAMGEGDTLIARGPQWLSTSGDDNDWMPDHVTTHEEAVAYWVAELQPVEVVAHAV